VYASTWLTHQLRLAAVRMRVRVCVCMCVHASTWLTRLLRLAAAHVRVCVCVCRGRAPQRAPGHGVLPLPRASALRLHGAAAGGDGHHRRPAGNSGAGGEEGLPFIEQRGAVKNGNPISVPCQGRMYA